MGQSPLKLIDLAVFSLFDRPQKLTNLRLNTLDSCVDTLWVLDLALR